MTTPAPMITLSHQYGSGGSLIAQELGQRLGWSVWDKEIVQKIASQQNVAEGYVENKDERVGSFIERAVGFFGVGGFETAYNIPPPLRLSDAQLARLTRGLIEDVAKEGKAIIVGRAGNYILADRLNTLHVFVFAPMGVRIERTMEVAKLTRSEAEHRIAGMDKIRTEYVHSLYQAEWRDPQGYHLQLDSGEWGEEGVADLIMWGLGASVVTVSNSLQFIN